MSQQIAHNIDSKCRTEDINIRDNVDFTAMLLSERVLHGLQANGFKKPSPVQLKAIPMGRCGFDLIIKAKSGTGKTAVFGIVALEMVSVKSNELQILILAPTREIAVQIQQVLLTIGVEMIGLKVEYFIGGTKLDDDVSKLKNCHIAVGAPGRVKHLIKNGAMKLDSVRLFVLDEADKLMQSSYQADINYIYNKLGPRKQMIASSATYPDELDKFLANYMTSPTHISPESEVPVLLGIKQFVAIVAPHLNVIQQMALKTDELVRILQTISFTQCIVFSNYQTRAESLSNNLTRLGWPAIHISGAQSQKDRLDAVHSLKEFKCRILSTTDLTARGIDAANVDLVINYEVPHEAETYLHRMGRAGRYGSYGICITIATDGNEVKKLQTIIGNIGDGKLSLAKYPKTEHLPKDIWQCDVTSFEQLTSKEAGLNIESKDTNLNVKPELCTKSERINLETSQPGTSKINTQLALQEIKSEILCIQNKQESINDRVKNDVISADNEVDFVEKTLNNLNKKQELTKTELKIQLGNIDAGALFENLVKEINQTHDNNVINEPIEKPVETCADQTICEKIDSTNRVEEILENISKQDELDKIQIKNKFGNVDSIFSMLAKSVKLDENKDGDKSECKKIKVNEKCENKSFSESVTNRNEQFENEAKMFQENNIVNKNIALYKLTSLLADEQQTVNEDCVTSIENLLNIIQEEDSVGKTKINLQNALASVLNIKSNSEINMTDSVINERELNLNLNIKQENINEKIQCGCAENLFSVVYSSAISKTNHDWMNSLCEKHVQDETRENYEQEEEESVQMYDDEEEYSSNEAYSTEENIVPTEYNKNNCTGQNITEYDEDLFVKAYDYALNSENDENQTEFTENMDATEIPEACGYVAGYSYKHFSCKTPNKRKHTNYENNMYTNENYESYYDYYDKILTESAPYFNNVQSFEKFFKKWQENVYSVRNYIQQDVYTKEMLRKNK